ncbi:hypothetical protein [Pleurocapsa sp. PCC 7319]|uniref:hypothetical protein n=1 Tax=Pleurocapsa sp. PCC 7319 TaxID=118161 RepID=UPI00034C93DA|nr:hypothetical protein [Pleurocapsa sp. PCC 7319]
MIYLPPPQPILNNDIRISGDVELHPTASLAPGVILQAAPNCRIVICADVCIGMGVIINACQGSVEIDSGAILGSGVLIVGNCKIGSNACVGTSTTIFQATVTAMTVIEPGSIIGDISRQVNLDETPKTTKVNDYSAPKPNNADQDPRRTSNSNNRSAKQPHQTVASDSNQEPNSSSIPQVEKVEPMVQKEKVPVVGQVYINELLVTLFPHNKDLNSHHKKSLE